MSVRTIEKQEVELKRGDLPAKSRETIINELVREWETIKYKESFDEMQRYIEILLDT